MSQPQESTMTHPFGSDPWNKLYDGMQLYHNHFRDNFNQIYSRSGSITSEAEDTEELDELLESAYGLYSHLDMHHSIEEYAPLFIEGDSRAYIFPILAERMPQFKPE